MTEPLRPQVAVAAAPILDVAAVTEGYALLTPGGIELYDAALAKRGAIAGEHGGRHVLALGERFLVHGTSWLYEGVAGGTLAKVDLGDAMVRSVVATDGGFLAVTTAGVLVDRAGTRTTVTVDGCIAHGGVPWRGGAVTAGHDGLAIFAADGSVVARSEEKLAHPPVALADTVVAASHDDVVVFDAAAQVVARIPHRAGDDGLVPFGAGVLLHSSDDETGASAVSYWEAGTQRWNVASVDAVQPPVVAGDWIVIASWSAGARILDGNGAEHARLDTGFVQAAVAFAGGVVVAVREAPDLLWWRPGCELARLAHDVTPNVLRAAPAGVISTEDRVVYVWRTDAQGPELVPVETALPMNAQIVIAGAPVRIVAAGRFALRGELLDGRAWRVAPDATWRPLTAPDEALRLLDRLGQRAFDGPLPEIPSDPRVHDVGAKLAQLPLAETADLHGRALFAQTTLDPEVRARSAWARGAFFAELGAALGMSGRAVLAAVKSRKRKLEPPRPVPGYEYLGTFTTSGALTVSDPCYVGKKSHPSMGITLSLKVAGHEGVWHVFVRDGEGPDRSRTAELVVIHDDGFEIYANELIGSIGIDSGTAGVFDKKCPRRDPDAPVEEGTFAALGALAHTGHGDGTYPVFVGRAKGRVAKIRLSFLGTDPEVDLSIARRTAAARPYSASATFAVGDAIEHVKFGPGAVVRVGGDGKIDVRFADATRTLVHGKKS